MLLTDFCLWRRSCYYYYCYCYCAFMLLLLLLLLRRLQVQSEEVDENFYNISLIEFVCIGIRHRHPFAPLPPLHCTLPSPYRLCSFVYKQGELCNKTLKWNLRSQAEIANGALHLPAKCDKSRRDCKRRRKRKGEGVGGIIRKWQEIAPVFHVQCNSERRWLNMRMQCEYPNKWMNEFCAWLEHCAGVHNRDPATDALWDVLREKGKGRGAG